MTLEKSLIFSNLPSLLFLLLYFDITDIEKLQEQYKACPHMLHLDFQNIKFLQLFYLFLILYVSVLVYAYNIHINYFLSEPLKNKL